MKYLKTVLIFFLATFACLSQAHAQEKPVKEIEVIGEFFGQPVPAQNYIFVKNVLLAFADRWSLAPESEERLDAYVWDYLLLSYEAFQNNIVATVEEIKAEIKAILRSDNVGFDWQKDKDAYAKWVKEKTNQAPAVFENQVRFMIEIDKLRQQVMDTFLIRASDEEAFRQFQDEHNLLSIEIAGFLKDEDAQGFYEKVKQSHKAWEEEKKKHPDSFKSYELTALNLLIGELSIDRATLYEMLELKNGNIHQPLRIKQGFGILKILNKKLAQDAEYAKLKYDYFEKIKEQKRNQAFQDWIGRVKQKAKIKIYRRGG